MSSTLSPTSHLGSPLPTASATHESFQKSKTGVVFDGRFLRTKTGKIYDEINYDEMRSICLNPITDMSLQWLSSPPYLAASKVIGVCSYLDGAWQFHPKNKSLISVIVLLNMTAGACEMFAKTGKTPIKFWNLLPKPIQPIHPSATSIFPLPPRAHRDLACQTTWDW